MTASPVLGARALLLAVGLVACSRPQASGLPDAPSPPAAAPAARPAATPTPLGPRRFLGFDAAKRALTRDVYGDRRTDVYCGCTFDPELRVDPQACGYAPRANAPRGERIEWEHLMPAARFGSGLPCWRGETEGCREARVRGRKCCARSVARGGDEVFRRMEGDLHNLAPAVGELNGDRSDRPFGLVAGEPRQYGRCDFEVDFDRGRAGPTEPPQGVWGDVARAWLYMSDEHRISLTPDERRFLSGWHAADPPDRWESVRDARIAALQGNRNRWVSPAD